MKRPTSITEIEKCLSALEKRLARLAKKVNARRASNDINGWIDQIHGTFRDDAQYRQAARSGRQWRKSKDRSCVKKSPHAFDLVKDLCGSVNGPADLLTNPKYMDHFGG
jgi:hypothetical protein